jgi:hypothetical protein
MPVVILPVFFAFIHAGVPFIDIASSGRAKTSSLCSVPDFQKKGIMPLRA